MNTLCIEKTGMEYTYSAEIYFNIFALLTVKRDDIKKSTVNDHYSSLNNIQLNVL